jgi:hypothetical protein
VKEKPSSGLSRVRLSYLGAGMARGWSCPAVTLLGENLFPQGARFA